MNDLVPLLAIACMAAATFLLRASGYWVMGRVPLTPRVRRGLDALPGSVIVSIVLPTVILSGADAVLCVAVAAVAMAALRRDFVAVVLALAATAAYRAVV